MTLSVLHIARSPVTGVWSSLRRLADWQLRAGYRVGVGILVHREWPEHARAELRELEAQGVAVFRTPSPHIPWTLAYLWHSLRNPLRDWVEEFARGGARPIVHFHNAWLAGSIASSMAGRADLVSTFHGIQAADRLRRQPVRRAVHSAWAQNLVQFDTALVSVDASNPHVADVLFGVPAHLFRVIYNGVEDPAARETQIVALNRHRTMSRSPLIVGQVGIIDEGKGWRCTAQAVEIARQRGFDIRLVIAGDGVEAPDAAEWCRSNSSFAEYRGYVIEPMRNVYPDLDIVVLPSLREGLPTTLLEAISLGIPVIGTRVGGIPEIIVDGENGYLTDQSSEMIADRICTIAADPEMRMRLSHTCRAIFRAKFTVDHMGRNYESFYLERFTDKPGTGVNGRLPDARQSGPEPHTRLSIQ